MHGRGELCSPAGVHRTPLRVIKIKPQKTKIHPDRLLKVCRGYVCFIRKIGMLKSVVSIVDGFYIFKLIYNGSAIN